MRNSLDLLTNATATGTAKQWGGGDGVFQAVASNWGGATASLEYLGPDGATWVAAGTNTTLTANGGGVFTLPPGQIRTSITGGPPTAVYAKAISAYNN